MEYNTFLKKVKQATSISERPSSCSYENKGDYLVHMYETGGMSGGSCWCDDPSEYSVEKIEDDFTKLEDVLTAIVPQLTYLQFKKINRVVKSTEYTDYEYYGNCTYNTILYIAVTELYKILNEMELL